MDEDMQQFWSNFILGKKESLGVHLLDQGDGELGEKGKLYIFGKVLSVKLYNKMAFKSTMKKVWNTIKVEFIEAGDNLFLIQYSNMLDKIRVLRGMSWSFDNHLVLLKEYDGSVQASKWERFEEHNKPKGGRGKIIGVKTGGVSPESGLESLEQSHKSRKAVNEANNKGWKGPISENEEIPIIESTSGRQNMEREMLVELREPSINISIPLLKETEIMDEGNF
ncbi:unnamed protein product [Ilex paraguariensis]|uniref:DUF4283 domain-containing protein n=1 Tax=Ilex paraguariensis TaxID=185542 RepID=A0ABC8RPQ9_9AQUA